MCYQGVCEYIETLLEAEIKFLVFARHLVVLSGVEKCVQSKKIGYIRIDGSTKPEMRQLHVDKFQNDPQCKVAILSTMAAGQVSNAAAVQRCVTMALYISCASK